MGRGLLNHTTSTTRKPIVSETTSGACARRAALRQSEANIWLLRRPSAR